MKRLLCVLLCLCLLPSVSLASSVDLTMLSTDELLTLWLQAGDRLKELDAYPYIELSKGDSGADVTNLQKRLSILYYYTNDITGKYDNNTIKAVKAWEKASGLKSDGKMSIDEQNLLYSDKAQPKATPTPKPSPTPAPTPVPDNAALEITDVSLRDEYNTKVFSLKLKNHSDFTIDAFTVAHRTFDAYGNLLSGGLLNKSGIQYAEWWKTLSLKPGKTFSMGSYYWYLFNNQTCAKIEVAISKYHRTDGQTIEINPDDFVWITGTL